MPVGVPTGAMCVQRLDDSLNSAIHTSFRVSLRSSSMPEPRDPLLKVLTCDFSNPPLGRSWHVALWDRSGGLGPQGRPAWGAETAPRPPEERGTLFAVDVGLGRRAPTGARARSSGNDPSAGSPTETLLRLLLPLNDQV